MKDNNKEVSVIEEAVIQLQAIVEAADKSAKDKLAKQVPEQFEKLLKEEINKNKKKESVQESVKDVTKEPVNEGKKTDGDKESLNEMEEIDLTELSINDIEEAYNEANSSDEFEVSADEINLDDVEAELGEMQNMAADVDSMQQEGDNPSDPFDKIKNLHKMLGEMIQDNEMTTNEMHDKVPHGATAPADSGHNTSPSGINEVDLNETLDPTAMAMLLTPIGLALGTLGVAGVKAALKKYSPKAAQTLDQLSQSAVKNSAGGQSTAMGESEEIVNEDFGPETWQAIAGGLGLVGGLSGGLVALENMLKEKYPKAYEALKSAGSAAGGSIQGGSTAMGESMVTETEEVIDEVDTVDDESKEDVDETAGSAKGHAANRTVGNENMPHSSPRKDSTQRKFQQESVNKVWSNESVQKFMTQKENMEKRMTSLINENKNVTKKLNETKAEAKKLVKVAEDQKKLQEAMVKYRNQLSEMAVFNTNLASVNNILVNEELALTADDKKELINKFKNVKTVQESEDTYKSVLSEMTSEKKTIVESVEDKVNDTIEPSAKVNEQTAYVNEHIDKIKGLMKYVDGHGNKRILS